MERHGDSHHPGLFMRWRGNLHESWSQTGCGSRRADVFPVLSFIIQESGAQFTDGGKKVGESGWERQDDFRLWEEGGWRDWHGRSRDSRQSINQRAPSNGSLMEQPQLPSP